MSIPVLIQVYDEMRRLAIAGSVVATGDFRLKKLIAPLEQSGAKAPVFAKAAEAVKAVVEGKEATSATALLELTTLVNAILYTQGETGAAGEWQPNETTDLGAPTTQTSARVLKPLLEALTTTGAGRIELIKEAFARGEFRDFRLVKPALEAIDDVYGEIGDFAAEKILPLYGKAILPDLRAKYDPKGRAGHPRRLRLMHALDPAGSREWVMQALDKGSKEVKVVAIECLGSDPADLSYLIEQASAKAQEVRQAAYRALATIDHDDAVAVLTKAMRGKDLDLVSDAVGKSRNAAVLKNIIAEAENELDGLAKNKDKKEVSAKAVRIQSLLGCLAGRDDRDSEAFLSRLFSQRDALAKIKGANVSGSDINTAVVHLMQGGTRELRESLAKAHGVLAAEELASTLFAARRVFPAAEVFEMFSPYLTAKVDEKKKLRDPAYAKREIIIGAIGGHNYYFWNRDDKEAALDPRWLDVAIGLKNLSLVRQLARPGHAGTNAFLKSTFDTVIKESKSIEECQEVVAGMVVAEHLDATDAFVAAFEKHHNQTDYYSYWFVRLIPELPKSALPKLEALLPTLNDKAADSMIGYIQQLRDKK